MRKSKYLVLIGVFILILPSIISLVNIKDNSDTVSAPEEDQLALEIDSKKPKSSGAFDYREIWIDDLGGSPNANGTWLWAETQPWCTDVYGDNSLYLIEDITLHNGDNTGSTLIIGNSTVNFIIQNCTILNSGNAGTDAGIYFHTVNNGKIFSCKISDCRYGVYLYGASSNNIFKNNTIDTITASGIRYVTNCNFNDAINNTITNFNSYGFDLSYADDCDIINNTVDGGLAGIHEYGCTNSVLNNNTLTNSGILFESTSSNDYETATIYPNNTVNGKPVYYYKNQNWLNTNNFTYLGYPGQIILYNSYYSTISNFNFLDASYGIHLSWCRYNNITSNTITNGRIGINLFQNCEDNRIYNNSFINCAERGIRLYEDNNNNTIINNRASNNVNYGIELWWNCDDNIITKNTLTSCNTYGIYIYYSYYNNITHNIVTDAGTVGIYLNDADNNLVYNNTANDNGQYGIRLSFASDNQIIENNCTETGDGDTQDYGIYVRYDCLRNDITRNEVHGSTQNGIYLFEDCGYNNISYNDVKFGVGHGIYLNTRSSNNTIFRNNLSENGGNGIWMSSYCLNTSIEENEIRDNDDGGIMLCDSNETYIANNDIIRNGFAGSWGGIAITLNSYHNNVTSNSILNNDDFGILLERADYNNISRNVIRDNENYGIRLSNNGHCSDDNLIYLNFFSGNTDWHVYIMSGCTGNELEYNGIGNWYDNYTGVDLDGDGIGDDPHDPVPEDWNNQDDFPIVDDAAPVITILNPNANAKVGDNAPNFAVRVQEKYIYKMWYSLDNWKTNVTFTKNGTINQALWDAVGNGIVRIKFYAEDKVGHNSTASVLVQKNVPSALPGAADDDDDDDDDLDDGGAVLVVVIVVIACVSAFICVIYILIQKGIIGTAKSR